MTSLHRYGIRIGGITNHRSVMTHNPEGRAQNPIKHNSSGVHIINYLSFLVVHGLIPLKEKDIKNQAIIY